MHSTHHTLRLAWRRLAAAPLFTVVAVITLALGIGANAAIFSVINGVLLRPLPFQEPERLVGVWHEAPGLGFDLVNQSPALHFNYREENRVFEDVGMWDDADVSVTGLEAPERVEALYLTEGTLQLLRAQPALGRAFSVEDDSPGTPETVILAWPYWQRKLGGDAGVLGRKLIVDGRPREVIGVMPREFRFLQNDPALLLPFRLNRSEAFMGNFSYQAVARLRPGVTLEQANTDVARMIPMGIEKFSTADSLTLKMLEQARFAPNLRPLMQDAVGDVGQVLWVLLGTVGIVLLIACANVANLFLVRAEARQQELAIRTALGAGAGRIARELLSESLTLGLAGGALGLSLAYAGIRLLVAMGPESLPRLEEISVDVRVLLFTLAISVLAGLLFGLLPVLRYLRPRVAFALREGGRTLSEGRERHRARNTLAVAQIALALVLLVGSGLMIRTFQALRGVNPGFTTPEEVLTLRIFIPEAEVPDIEQAVRMHEQILRRIEAIPGVNSVGLSSSITMDGSDSNDPLFVEDHPTPEGQLAPIRRYKWISQKYFETMGNPILAGRGITWADIYRRAPVVMVTENLAREYWQDPAEAVGKRVKQSPPQPWREIIGVVADEYDDGVSQKPTATVYWPMLIREFWDEGVYGRRTMAYAIRTARSGTSALLREVQRAVWSINPNLPLADVRTLDEMHIGRTSCLILPPSSGPCPSVRGSVSFR